MIEKGLPKKQKSAELPLIGSTMGLNHSESSVCPTHSAGGWSDCFPSPKPSEPGLFRCIIRVAHTQLQQTRPELDKPLCSAGYRVVGQLLLLVRFGVYSFCFI